MKITKLKGHSDNIRSIVMNRDGTEVSCCLPMLARVCSIVVVILEEEAVSLLWILICHYSMEML